MNRWAGIVAAVVLAVNVLGCTGSGDPVFVGAGDIASLTPGDDRTADLLDGIPGTVFTLGDDAYPDGSPSDFADFYAPTWGRDKARTHPAVGNHEYNTPGAAGYYAYFGAAAGDPTKGYYGFDLGAWHIIVLNGNCDFVSCAAGSPQEGWLRAELAAHTNLCIAALWHQPRFSSGSEHGNYPAVAAFWDDLYAANAEIVLNGHDHDYERFAPQAPDQSADPARGIREFVVGTGGVGEQPFDAAQPNSEVRNTDSHGVLKLTLHPTSYDWQFVPVVGDTFTDSGTGSCH
jgi:hypothetical protein